MMVEVAYDARRGENVQVEISPRSVRLGRVLCRVRLDGGFVTVVAAA